MLWLAVCSSEMQMSSDWTENICFNKGQGRAFTPGLAASLFILLGTGSGLIVITVKQASINTVLLFVVVAVSGLILCTNVQKQLKDRPLKILKYFWLLKLAITLFLLYAGWTPQLFQTSLASWGYDPQRYYFQAQKLIEHDWSSYFVALNYKGILYYYGAIFYVFGHNPVIPALINAFITLIATLYLIKVCYEIKGLKGPLDWKISFALLLPEVLWYDVMTSRETLLAALLLFSMLTAGRLIARTASISLFRVSLIIGFSLLAIGFVRSSMLLPLSFSIALMVLLIQPKRGSHGLKRTILVVVATAALLVGPILTGYLGGYDFDVGNTLESKVLARENINVAAAGGWSEQSLGALFIPHGFLQSILFLPPRMVLYLVTPIPNVFISLSDLLNGSWGAWQKLLTLFSSLINIFVFPYVLASLVESIKTRKTNAAPIMLHISYWITFVTIAGGNLIIHERYRVMASLMLFGCAWLGANTCSKKLITRALWFWYGLLVSGALFYVIYKF